MGPEEAAPSENPPLSASPLSASLLKTNVRQAGYALSPYQGTLPSGDAIEQAMHFPLDSSTSLQGISLQGTGLPSDVPPLFHNLPTRDYGTFVGRARPLQQLMTFLHSDHPAARVSVTGIGGMGKTALVLEVAHRCRVAAISQAAERSQG